MVTLKHIAEELGLSLPTVSRGLRGSPRVSERTRHRIRQAAERLGYVPDHAASGLKTRRSRMIGVLVPSFVTSYWSEIVEGIERKANTLGYAVMIGVTGDHAERVAFHLGSMLSKRVDGILRVSHTGDYTGDWSERLAERGVVLVDVDNDGVLATQERLTLGFDNEDGAWRMTRRLIDLGHRRIVHVAGPLERSRIARRRCEGFLRALREVGLGEIGHDARLTGDYTFEDGLRAGETLLARAERPTAVFACSDAVAAGVMRAAHRLGLRVPDDLSVAGFGNEVAAQQLPVGLTTVDLPTIQIGELAFERFHKRLDRETPTMAISLPTRLVERETCAPPRELETANQRESRSATNA